ncbi:MAG: tetratricopeptide repeat protein [Chitinophagaceae bacterium]
MNKTIFIQLFAAIVICFPAFGQPGLSFELKKPKKFENKTLGSEKTGNKKFTVPRRIIQNTVTHYNYYFNANNKLNEVIARAKTAHKEDYSQLLPFYNYTLQSTASQKNDLDSVILKSTAGVLIHDLRNDWVDNLYLLIGKAYYLRNEQDSAYLSFQYLNYAFSPKEKDGYDKVIGSNENEGSNAFSISTKEKSNIVKKVFSRPPSRNESFIWQIKTFLAREELPEAAGLIETLRNDPAFPERLQTDLQEAQALYFYKQLAYDSAAFHLEKALGNAENNQEQARWEYLIAQLYEKAGKPEQAKDFFEKAIKHTVDPVLEVYARLNAIKQNTEDEKGIQVAVDELSKMGRKDRYALYRDIIYYTAAVIELERNNEDAAKAFLLKSARFSTTNAIQKSRSYLALGDIYFNKKQYSEAKQFYDSVQVLVIGAEGEKMFAVRKGALERIVAQIVILKREDSLQKIAAMPEDERNKLINKLVKELRKKQGFKDDEKGLASDGGFSANNNGAPTDLFGGNTGKGDWYFYNASLKGKGLTEFKVKWGNRPNADNWRRQSAIPGSTTNQLPPGAAIPGLDAVTPVATEISYDVLLSKVPLTPSQQKISAGVVENALLVLGKEFMNGLEDYSSAIGAFEKLLQDFPSTMHAEEVWYNLYYCYTKTGNQAGQAHVKKVLSSTFANGKFSNLLINRNMAMSPDSILKIKATRQYQDIYNLFIEGNFTEALLQKKAADSLYGQNYWTPQLLYIEAVYHIRQREDSVAKIILSKIIQLYPSSPMNAKSANLLNVLSRRKEIEDYLTKLEIERPKEDAAMVPKNIGMPPPKKVDSLTSPRPDSLNVQKRDTLTAQERITPDSVVAKEIQPQRDANSSIVKGGINQPINKPAIENRLLKGKADSLQIVKKPDYIKTAYSRNDAEAHYVVFVLDKVDPVYATEAVNAFNRYHRENYTGQAIEITSLALTGEVKLLLFKNFENAATALDYVQRARKRTENEIIPWLTAQKYSFAILAESNLEVLQNTKDITSYKKWLTDSYPGLF